ncbi:hypothetical protein VUN84_08010 [Micrococcaceae bacterium Sec5.8]
MPAESYSEPVREELQLSRADAYARGRQQRRTTPRSALAERSTAHRGAVAHIREQNEDRNQELVTCPPRPAPTADWPGSASS